MIRENLAQDAFSVEVDDGVENWDVNRPADVMLPSPARVDKEPKRWNIAEDSWTGSAKKASPAARGKSIAAAEVQAMMEGEHTSASGGEGGRPERKRKSAKR